MLGLRSSFFSAPLGRLCSSKTAGSKIKNMLAHVFVCEPIFIVQRTFLFLLTG